MAGSGANTVRLTKLNPLLGSGKKPSGGSLLNPSYMGSGGDSSSDQDSRPQKASIAAYLAPQPAPLAIRSSAGSSPPSSRGGDWGDYRSDRDDRKRRDAPGDSSSNNGADRTSSRKKRKSRWGGDENEKTFIPGMPTILPGNMDKDQEQAYLIQLQIEDYTRRLRSGDLGISANPEKRSPSPEPIYGSDGKRLNTRDYRTRRRLEDERHKLIIRMFELNPEYKPPVDYKPPANKVTDKIQIPQDDHPEINFIGLLIGPRGNTLKALEKESGAKIIIRGKGSVKEGKVGRKDGLPMPGEDEPLHALISSSNPECVKRAVDRIKQIIREGVEVPEDQNDLRKNQLRELALLNGTLRDGFTVHCHNCGAANHKSWQCPDKPNVTNNIICNACGGAGHIARDCIQRRPGMAQSGSATSGGMAAGDDGVGGGERAKIDEEYLSLMAELGEGPPPPSSSGGYGNNMQRYTSPSAFATRSAGSAPLPIMAPPSVGGMSGGQSWPSAPPPGLPPSQPPPAGLPPSGWGMTPPPSQHGQGPPRPLMGGAQPPAPGGLHEPQKPPQYQGLPPPQQGGPGGHQGGGGGGWGGAPQWRPTPPPNPQQQRHPGPGPVPPPRSMGPPQHHNQFGGGPQYAGGPPRGPYGGPQQHYGGGPPQQQPPRFGGPRPGGGPGQFNGGGMQSNGSNNWRPQQQQHPYGNMNSNSGGGQSQRPDLNMLAQAGLPNLLAAPPPPPPS